jgi:hypothetical protein
MNLPRSSPHRSLLRSLRLPWGTSGPRCTRGLKSRFLPPPSPLARAPTNPTGPAPPSRTRTPVHQVASIMGFVRLRPSPRGSFTSVEVHRSRLRAKDTRRRPTISSRSLRCHTTLTNSRTPILQARVLLLNQTHHRPCTILKTSTIRPSRTFSRIRRYPRYQVLLRVTPLPSSTTAAINF